MALAKQKRDGSKTRAEIEAKIERAKAKIAREENRLREIEQREKTKKRKAETRAKILIGTAFIKFLERCSKPIESGGLFSKPLTISNVQWYIINVLGVLSQTDSDFVVNNIESIANMAGNPQTATNTDSEQR